MGTMTNNNRNSLASAAAALCLDIEHGFVSSDIAADLSEFLTEHEESLSEEEYAHLAADVERLTDKPNGLVYAAWARTTLTDIWRSHR